jgi:segregation and condensation protein A
MEPSAPATDIPDANAFRVQISSFEGPLDLLLHLIRAHELNILDLPIAFVTERYLEYLGMMRELDLDVASEYLLMAATLAHIKSKELLPQVPDEQQDIGEEAQEDPRTELIRRLLEYQKYKAVADELGARSLEGRDVFVRGTPPPEAEGPAPLAEVGLFQLLDAFERVLRRVQGRFALEITADSISVQERMTQLVDLLRDKRSCEFEQLFENDRTRSDVVVTFLALLEMTRLHMTRVFQPESRGALHVQYALLDADAPSVPPAAGGSGDDAAGRDGRTEREGVPT